MSSRGAGRGTERGTEKDGERIKGYQKVTDAWLARDRAIALSNAIDHLDEDMNLPPQEGYDDPGLDTMPDVDEFDLSEYDQDGPYKDPDDPDGPWDGYDDPLNVPGPGLDPLPYPQVIIDTTGGAVIPVETWLQRRLAGTEAPTATFTAKWEAALRIRKVVDRMIQEWKEILLDPDKRIGDLPPTSRAEFAERAGIGGKSYLDHIVARRYVATPYWGVVPMSAFFGVDEAREAAWDVLLSEVIDWIRSEDPEHPVKTEVLWIEVNKRLSESDIAAPQDNKMFRERLNKRGIPAAPANRSQIYAKVKKWWKQTGKPDTYPRSAVPMLRKHLMEQHGLFSSSKARLCQGEVFRPFVEERIARVLQDLKVRLTP